MGGWMTYGRMRNRNDLLPRDHENPYVKPNRPIGTVIGDLNRMERDYLDPVYPEAPYALRGDHTDPTAECAAATGVDEETVRKVLRYVFLESR